MSSRRRSRGVSLRTTLLAAFAYVLLLVIIALEVPLVLNLSRRVDAEVKAEASGQAQLVAASAGDDLDNPGALQRIATRSAEALGGRVIVLDRRGILLADSAGPGLLGTSYASRPEVSDALAGEQSQGTRESSSLGEALLFTSVPVLRNGRNVGAVRVTQSVEAVRDEVRSDALALIGVGVIALLLGVGVAWLLAGSLARAPRQLAATARRVADGDLEARAQEEGPREEREVATAFNEMTSRLAAALAAQRDFVANASHQLRTPLTGLRLRIEAASDLTDTPNVERELQAAELELERLARLLTNLLALARGAESSAEGRAVSLAACVRAACERWRSRAEEEGYSLEASREGGVEVLAAGEELGIVLDNLIENALSYAPPGTRIVVSSGRAGDYGVLRVQDEGPGIEEAEAERVLERFYRGRSAAGQQGTGLGLAIVRVIAERWDGALRLSNRPDGGLDAQVAIPLAEKDFREANAELANPLPERG